MITPTKTFIKYLFKFRLFYLFIKIFFIHIFYLGVCIKINFKISVVVYSVYSVNL